jgi:(p)ppGpp synthase/HD superfamily hydrolase
MISSETGSALSDFRTEQAIRLGNLRNKIRHSEDLWARLCKVLKFDEMNKIQSVRTFAETLTYVHPGLNSKEYILHPIRVASLGGLFVSQDRYETAKIGLLHNVYEVGAVETKTIIEKFGPDVDFALKTLNIDRLRQADYEYLTEYYNSIAQLPGGLGIVKVLDKIDNMYTIHSTASLSTRLNYMNEIKEFVVPLCEKVAPKLKSNLLDMIRHVS